MTTEERLLQYYPFDEDIIAKVAEAAESQRQLSFTALAERYGLGKWSSISRPLDDENIIQFWNLDQAGTDQVDKTKVRLYHAPMANPAGPNMAMRAIRLYAADPSVPLMVAGNPAGIRRGGAKIAKAEYGSLRRGDFSAIARPLLAHLAHNGVKRVETVGFSFGADVAVASASLGAEFGISVEKSVLMEPASVALRGIGRLLNDFRKSGAELDRYVQAADSKALIEARQAESRQMSFVNWAAGLTTPVNRAIARGIARGTFAERVQQALETNSDLATTVAWGSQSELSTPTELGAQMRSLQPRYAGRLHTMELAGMHHAGGDDIDLHAAIVLQGLKDAAIKTSN